MKLNVEFKEHKKMNIKRIIAREGLVIFGIILFSLLLIFVSNQINKPVKLTPLELADFEIVPQDESDAMNKIMELREEYPQYNDLSNLELAKRMAGKFPEWETTYKVMQRVNEESIKKHYKYNYAVSKPRLIKPAKLKEMVSSWSLYVLIFGYPFYLLIRFILWAIKTLKEK